MQITVDFTDLYDGSEYKRTETFDVEPPSGDLDDWAYDNIFPRTGDGRAHERAAYFATITVFADRPDLVGREFEWGL
ncbi:hypothetical protein MMAG44476_22122 [Mycolicibacterium mageritense DSM 44476 = CIP 104973]|jgi:hypothetical protein|uniref:Uncharacterized protein n=1 Tax=Mycolicibacterium canariasense TaxID=228230 RepID=A0A117I9H6_MYCCR|nr:MULTISPECIES: hypothetical protein [Mycolicibacterium]MCC9179491.1 hypothetical protein [Mycolicibacterium mageritense]MCV7211502.1 hypothetical protein [Mycolicibacterium canariasense]ORV10528.1 hypothetical protein AWB94_07480 [Mycolicibacterium canariasense]GAS94834.1 uncharacterized protein RMCC_1800 [Mycolicibacterium canariasense]